MAHESGNVRALLVGMINQYDCVTRADVDRMAEQLSARRKEHVTIQKRGRLSATNVASRLAIVRHGCNSNNLAGVFGDGPVLMLPQMASAATSDDLLALWIGPALSFLERACLRSALAQGHTVALYSYHPIAGVPEGVELRDAEEILPESDIIYYRKGSPAQFANRFRYELLRRSLGTWIDCDVYFLRPLPDLGGHVFGDQGMGKFNNAVLRLPPDAPIVADLLALFAEDSVPPWLPIRSRIAAQFRLALTGRSNLSRMPWGSTGPEALTALARKHGIDHLAQPASMFYPVHWTQADWICSPDIAIEDVIHHDTVAVHLWNERLRGLNLESAPASSFAARLCEEGA